jgi:flagellar motor switch protein FliN/FliY
VVQPVQFAQIEDSGARAHGSIDVLLDVRLPISVELGRTDMEVKEILECGPGTVIELNKLAGEPVDIYINGRMVAQGEVVVVDEHFGVRVTSLLTPSERVRSLA